MTSYPTRPLGYLIESTEQGPRAIAHYADLPLALTEPMDLTAQLGDNATAVQVLAHATGTGVATHSAAHSGDPVAKAECPALALADQFADDHFAEVSDGLRSPYREVYIHHATVLLWLARQGVVV